MSPTISVYISDDLYKELIRRDVDPKQALREGLKLWLESRRVEQKVEQLEAVKPISERQLSYILSLEPKVTDKTGLSLDELRDKACAELGVPTLLQLEKLNSEQASRYIRWLQDKL